MRLIENIDDSAYQRHTIIFEESEITLKLRFLPGVAQWFFDVSYGDFSLHGKKLAVGVFHMQSSNKPFDFTVIDNSGNGLDPFRLDDFSRKRCSIYLLESDDMETIRGVAVEI